MTAAARPDRSWRTAVVAVVGLLIAIAVIGLVGIVINDNIHRTVERAINFDVELEDRGDDLRVAVLEVRHFHRDLLLNAPDVARIDLWQGRYDVMIEEVDAVEAVVNRQPDSADLPDISALRRMAETYHAEFSAALAAEPEDPAAFRVVAEDLLIPIDAMQRMAQAVDQAGEERAQGAFAAIDEASATGTLILVGVILGLGAMGVFLGIAVLRLVQDQRRLVAVEQAALASMAEASRAKTDFIADASHELRTPLTVLRGNAEIGLTMDATCSHAEILGEIVDEAARMSRLVDDLLFLARSDASRVPLDLREVDVAEAFRALAGRAEVLARERGARLETQAAAAGTIRADPARIDQAILVLVDNAAKYGPPHGTIELAMEIVGERLMVEVRDRGPGIPPELLSRVFERFYRVEATARDRPARGSGLGLSIAAAIVEGHGGQIVAEPRFGGGTIMRVTLPMRAGRLEAAPATAG
jgi:two-component system, OmpR family, sensor histidine kinase VicK